MFSPALVVTPHIAAGTLRGIGVTGAARSALFPDFPTIAETGLAGYQSLGWFGLFAPAGTPREIVAKVSADVGRVLALPDAKQRLAEQGAEPRAEHAGSVHGLRERGHRQMARVGWEGGDQIEPLMNARAIEADHAGTRLGWCKWRMTSLGPVSRPRRHGPRWTRSSTNVRRPRQ